MTDRLTDEARSRIERHADATGAAPAPIPRLDLATASLPNDVRARIEEHTETYGKVSRS